MGSHLILNSGLASHGGGMNRGLSKALCMVIALLLCPGQYVFDLDFTDAWIAINILHFQPHFRPILVALAKSCEFFFWVSYDS